MLYHGCDEFSALVVLEVGGGLLDCGLSAWSIPRHTFPTTMVGSCTNGGSKCTHAIVFQVLDMSAIQSPRLTAIKKSPEGQSLVHLQLC